MPDQITSSPTRQETSIEKCRGSQAVPEGAAVGVSRQHQRGSSTTRSQKPPICVTAASARHRPLNPATREVDSAFRPTPPRAHARCRATWGRWRSLGPGQRPSRSRRWLQPSPVECSLDEAGRSSTDADRPQPAWRDPRSRREEREPRSKRVPQQCPPARPSEPPRCLTEPAPLPAIRGSSDSCRLGGFQPIHGPKERSGSK